MRDMASTLKGESVTIPLRAGDLRLDMDEGARRPDLFRVAERINPKRAFLFVSTVLGRHIPVRPRDHMRAAEILARDVSDALQGRDALVVGYAETAVGLGGAVARSLSRMRPDAHTGYLSTTRHPVEGRNWFSFTEGHSHAAQHYVLRPNPDVISDDDSRVLVLVDDEATTGVTFASLVKSARDADLRFSEVILVTLTDWSAGNARDIVRKAGAGVPVSMMTLMTGEWAWSPNPAYHAPKLPECGPSKTPCWAPEPTTPECYAAPRLGTCSFLGPNIEVFKARGLSVPDNRERTLVIGTGENVWGPMLFAESLEDRGCDVSFVATTRSPVIPGDVIREKMTFSDHFGEGRNMYLHNVVPEKWDHIILMTETPHTGVCPALRNALGRAQIVSGQGHVKGIS